MVLEGDYELVDGTQWKPLKAGEVEYSLRAAITHFAMWERLSAGSCP
jgi:hypothetical protein